jgi:hypothetical protein
MRERPRPFVVVQNGRPVFTVHAYTAQQARDLIAARGFANAVILPVSKTAPPCRDTHRQG